MREYTFKNFLGWSCLIAAGISVLVMIGRLGGCSVEPRKRVEVRQAPPVDAPTCDGAALGKTVEEECEGGKRVLICTADGYQEAVNTCGQGEDNEPPPPARCTTFASLKTALTRECSGCHSGYDTYAVASSKADEFIRRMKLDSDNPQSMPKAKNWPRDVRDAFAAPFETWRADGKPESECPDEDVGNDTAGVNFDYLEAKILEDLTAQDPDNRAETRYLVSMHRIKAKAGAEEIATFGQAANKGVNSVSLERETYPLVEIAPGIFRVDLDEFGLDGAKWKLIEDADKINIESFTSRGNLIKLLAETRKPWLHVDNFNDVALRNSKVYYDLLEIPSVFEELTDKLGVDYADDLEVSLFPVNKPEATLAAFVGSPLSPHNRMVSHHESDDGSFWSSYDTGALDTAEKNYFEFPLLADVGGDRNAQFIAGEFIFDLPNGLHAYALYNAKQTFVQVNGRPVFVRSDFNERQDVAPQDVVRDWLNPVTSEIRAGISCFRCHSGGILPFSDQIRDHVERNGSQFPGDKDFILAVYKKASVMQGLVRANNEIYANRLRAFGVDATQADPITVAQDRFLTAWDLNKTAAFLFLEPEEFRALINQSAVASAQVGQLVSGGTITYDQLVATLPALIADLRLFQDSVSR